MGRIPKTHCKYGHPLNSTNVIISRNSKECRVCKYTRTNTANRKKSLEKRNSEPNAS